MRRNVSGAGNSVYSDRTADVVSSAEYPYYSQGLPRSRANSLLYFRIKQLQLRFLINDALSYNFTTVTSFFYNSSLLIK